ncbi:MAG TPA: Gfo/Idh/MocA family oxidoreductase [Pelagibacteraceae bacterium]|nr:Gfo/Idh/MocA family oxidoreductase [Pelagibacteraceae bacterium]
MYKVCLIGHGYWGSKLARNFQNSQFFNIIAIADNKQKNLASAKKTYPIIKYFKDYKKAIKNDSINLVIISSPTSTHFKIAKYALENSKHILVEKPLSLSLNQVKNLNKIARIKKRMIFVDYPFLFSGTINFLKKTIDKKKYGEILEIESYREQAPIRKDTNVIWDLGAHDISILTYLLKKQPYKIQTIKKKNFKNSLCDTAYINLKYKNNLNVLIKNSWVSPTKIRLIKIKFKNAILYSDENESLYKVKVFRNKLKKDWGKYNLEIPEIDLNEPLAKMVNYIFYAIKNNNNYLFSGKFNEKVTYLLEKINKIND